MRRQAGRNGLTSPFAIAAIVCALALLAWGLTGVLTVEADSNVPMTHLSDVARRNDALPSLHEQSSAEYKVTIQPGQPAPRIPIQATGPMGSTTVTVACSTCHSTRPPDVTNKQPSDLDEFHQGLAFSHNELSCLSCHNPNDYDSLRLADGTAIPYEDVMTLCAQCHGPQTRDFEHGAHGGMTGYWDLTRGPRQRNNCVDCHHPHTPEFPKMKPTFKPRDRFLDHAVEIEHSKGSKLDE